MTKLEAYTLVDDTIAKVIKELPYTDAHEILNELLKIVGKRLYYRTDDIDPIRDLLNKKEVL